MVGEISTATRTEVLGAVRSRYMAASKRDKSRMLDEFVAIAGCHRKHAVRLLNQDGQENSERSVPRGRRTYDEAVSQVLIVVWEASDRICGKGLKAALPSMVEPLERHGHLDLDPDVRERLFAASASTIDRLLRPVREQAGSRRRIKRRRKMGSRVPVRTFPDWNEPTPGYLEIDLVAHNGGVASGTFIHSLVVTDVSSGWTETVPFAGERAVAGGRRTRGHLRCLSRTDAADRIKEHRERKEKLEASAEEARAVLSKRRVTLDKIETITAFAQDMSEYLKTSELTESRAFIRSFVKEIEVRPGKATIHYSISTPGDSPIEGGDAAEVVLNGGVMNMGVVGGAGGTRTPCLFNAIEALSQMSYSPTGSGRRAPPVARPI